MKTAEARPSATIVRQSTPFFHKGESQSFFGQDSADTSFFSKTSTSTFIQPKLSIGRPGDKYEQEADAMADQVVQRLSQPEALQTKSTEKNTSGIPVIQAKCAACEQEEKLQRKEEWRGEEQLQRKPIFESNAPPPDEEIQRKCAACVQEEKLQKKARLDRQADGKPGLQTKPALDSSLSNHSYYLQRKPADGGAEDQVERLQEADNESPESEFKAQEAITDLEAPEIEPSSVQKTEDGLTENEHPEYLIAELEGETTTPHIDTNTDEGVPEIATKSKSEGASEEPVYGLEQQLTASRGGGSPLNDDTRQLMEVQLGADFSGVRVHTGSQAAEMNQALGAQAFTHGHNIYFNDGKYNTSSSPGKHLLAHELTHTIQQGASVNLKRQPVTKTYRPRVQRGLLGDVWGATGGKVVSGVKSGAKWAGGKVVSGAKWVGGKAKDAFMWIYNKIKKLINKGKDWINNKWEALKSFADGGLNIFKSFFERIIHFIKSPFGFIANAIMNMDATALQQSWGRLTDFVLKIWDGFHKLGMGLLKMVEKLWNTINGFASKLFSKIDDLTGHWAFKRLPSSIQNIVYGLIGKLRSLWNSIKSVWNFIFMKVKTFVDKAFKTIRELIKKILSFAIDTIITGIIMFGKVLVFIMDLLQNPMKYLKPLSEKLVGYLGGVEGAFPGQINKYFGGGIPATADAAGMAGSLTTDSPTTTSTGSTSDVIQKKDDPAARKGSASWSEIGAGVWGIMKDKWEEVKKDPSSIILNLLLDLALPIVGNVKDIIKLFKDIKKIVTKPFSAGSLEEFWTSILRLLDIPILIYNTFWSIIGRTLALPLLVASFIPHPVVKGIAIAAGYGLLAAMIAGESMNISHKLVFLKTGKTDDEEKKEAYNSLSDSLIAFAMEVALAIFIMIVSAVANVIKGIFSFVKGKVFSPKAPAKPPGKAKADTGGGKKPDPTEPGKKKISPEESKATLENTKGKDGQKLTPEEIKTEFDSFKDGKLQKSTEPGYDWEMQIPNGHKWKRKKNGKWCRQSTKHCFNEELPFQSDREFYEFLKKEGHITESFDDFTKTKPGGPPSGTDITAEIKNGQYTKPTTGRWKNAPNWNNWVEKGGKIIKHGDGSLTYMTKDGKWVKYNSNGYPDFSNHLTHPEVKSIDIPEGFHPNRTPDYKRANELVGKGGEWGSDPPAGYRWHHHQNGRTMQLVPKAIHELFTHAGGISKL